MLTLKAPIQLHIAQGLTGDTEAFGRRILANYELLGARFTPKDLLFLLTAPPELPEDLGGMTTLISQTTQVDQRSVTLDVVNNVINRVLLDGSSRFTYQDQVYITSVLNRLGITNVNEFMEQVRQLRTQSENTVQLTKLYQKELERVIRQQAKGDRELVLPISREKTGEEGAAVPRDPRVELSMNILQRLETSRVYETVHAFQHSYMQAEQHIHRNELRLAEQLRFGNTVALAEIKQQFFEQPQIQLLHHLNQYEAGTLLEVPKSEEAVLSQATVAALMNAVDNTVTQVLNRPQVRQDTWLRLENALWQTAENSVSRFESYHNQYLLRPDGAAQVVRESRDHYTKEAGDFLTMYRTLHEKEFHEQRTAASEAGMISQLIHLTRQEGDLYVEYEGGQLPITPSQRVQILREVLQTNSEKLSPLTAWSVERVLQRELRQREQSRQRELLLREYGAKEKGRDTQREELPPQPAQFIHQEGDLYVEQESERFPVSPEQQIQILREMLPGESGSVDSPETGGVERETLLHRESYREEETYQQELTLREHEIKTTSGDGKQSETPVLSKTAAAEVLAEQIKVLSDPAIPGLERETLLHRETYREEETNQKEVTLREHEIRTTSGDGKMAEMTALPKNMTAEVLAEQMKALSRLDTPGLERETLLHRETYREEETNQKEVTLREREVKTTSWDGKREEMTVLPKNMAAEVLAEQRKAVSPPEIPGVERETLLHRETLEQDLERVQETQLRDTVIHTPDREARPVEITLPKLVQPDERQMVNAMPPVELTPQEAEEQAPEVLLETLQQIDQRNRTVLQAVRQELQKKESRDSTPSPDIRRTMRDALRALEDPEQVLREIVSQPGRVETLHPPLTTQEEALLSQADPATRALYERVLMYEKAPEAALAQGLVRPGNLGELNAQLRQAEQVEPAALEHRQATLETQVQETQTLLETVRQMPGQYPQVVEKPVTAPEALRMIHKQPPPDITEELLERLEQQRTTTTVKTEHSEAVNRQTVHRTDLTQTERQLVHQTNEEITDLVNRTLARQMRTISDQVYRQMEKRLQNERNRRGRF